MSDELLQSLRDAIRTVPDFPIEGIMFRDITPCSVTQASCQASLSASLWI